MSRFFLLLLLAVAGCRVLSDDIPCTDQGACPKDLVCAAGRCVVDAGGRRGGDEGEEGEGEGGVEGEGDDDEVIACETSDTCPGTDVCVEGGCRTDCSANDDADCAADEVCESEGFFVDVVHGCVEGCRDDASCGGSTPICDPQAPHRCRARAGDGGVGALCVSSSDCDSPFVCHRFEGEEFGFCTEECDEDPDEIGPTDCTTFGCCALSGFDRCSLGFCFESCDDRVCSGAPDCCFQTGLPSCFTDLCVYQTTAD